MAPNDALQASTREGGTLMDAEHDRLEEARSPTRCSSVEWSR